MSELIIAEVYDYVNANIENFHHNRIGIISNLRLSKLTSKNPYLFRAKNINKASELIDGTLEAFLSSSEEKLFGDFLEELAIFIAERTTDGRKSSATGMDLEFVKDGFYNIVSIKSGPNWGNSSQHKKLEQDFRNAETVLRQSSRIASVEKVLGICYGCTRTAYMPGGYLKIVGQNFWTYISNNKNLYIDIIEPVGYCAREHNEKYLRELDRVTNKLTNAFIDMFCTAEGYIDWELLLEVNSGNYDLDDFFGL